MNFLRLIFLTFPAIYDFLYRLGQPLASILPSPFSVSYVLSSFERTEQALARAQAEAVKAAEAYEALAEKYDDLAEGAYNDADRAAKVQARLAALLR